MKYSKPLSILFALVVSFVMGWQLNISSVDKSLIDPTLTASVGEHPLPEAGQASAAETSQQGSKDRQAMIISQPRPENSQKEFDEIKIKLAELDQELKNGAAIGDLNSQLDVFLDFFRETDFQDSYMNLTRIIDQIQESPELYGAFLDRYPNLPEKDQWLVAGLLFNPDSLGNEFRENYIVEKLKVGDHTSTWLKVLGQQGIRENSTLEYLIDQISYLTDPDDLASAITASSSIFESPMISAKLAMPRRDDVSELYKPFFESQEEPVRTAALGTLVAYPRPDEIDIIDRALSDESQNYRHEALNVLIQRSLTSTSLQTELYGIIRNEEEPNFIRRSASLALKKNATARPPQDVIDIANQLFRDPQQ